MDIWPFMRNEKVINNLWLNILSRDLLWIICKNIIERTYKPDYALQFKYIANT